MNAAAAGGPREVDVLCVHPPRQQHQTGQSLEFEMAVSRARSGGLTAATAGYPDRGPSAPDAAAALAAFRPRVVYWHVPNRGAVAPLRAGGTPAAGAVELAGGDFAGRHGEGLLGAVPRLDGTVRGEPEETLAAVAAAVRDGADWRREAGLTVRREGGVRSNPPRPLPDDLDPLAARAEDFFTDQRRTQGHRVMISRGCNSDCLYCGLQTPYRSEHAPARTEYWRARSVAAVLDEIERFHALGVRSFYLNSFVVFGYDERGAGQMEAIARGIVERGLDLELRFVTLVRDLHRNLDLLPLLVEAGLAQLTVGIDSGLPRALATYRVDQTPEQARDCLAALSRLEIPFVSSFIFYDPYLSLPELRANLRFLDSLAPYYAHMEMPFSYFLDQQLLNTVLRVRQDTPIYGRLVEDGLAEAVDPLEREPRVGMRHPEVGRLFQVHQAVNKLFMPSLRPLLWSRAAAATCPAVERLPRDLLERLADLYQAEPDRAPASALAAVAAWLHQRLAGDWDELVAAVGSGAGDAGDKRRHLDEFFATLTERANAA